jgi:iron complex transport system ATP-binding protein
MLTTHALSYSIDEKRLIQTLNLEIKEGENLTILGANGAGKTTLAKLLCGLIKSKKMVRLKERYIEEIDSITRAKLINYTPSKFSLYDRYIKVDEYLNLSCYKIPIDREKSVDILSILGLYDYHDSYASRLSSGEQQLLLIASSMMQGAKITIFDEPTSNLDPKKRKLIFDIFQHSNYLSQKILITHDLQLAYKLNYPILYLDKEGAHYFPTDFFTPKRLHKYFGDTIQIIDNQIVEVL